MLEAVSSIRNCCHSRFILARRSLCQAATQTRNLSNQALSTAMIGAIPDKEREYLMHNLIENLNAAIFCLTVAIKSRDAGLAIFHLKSIDKELDKIRSVLEKGLPTR